ncbi:hypothetical protein WJX74_009206 [Apatococcus lobatus]|uniref:Uncharacterized protein n=1 Tax=Apatococcus lobatus TaxID=904363 RepID=A0AAW1SGB3_9CHLO
MSHPSRRPSPTRRTTAMPHFGRDHQRGPPNGGPYEDSYRWMEWSAPSEGRKTLLYRRSLHRAVAIDPDSLDWWTADLQPWTCERHRGLEVALRERLPEDCLPDRATHGLAVDVLRRRVHLDDAARDLCLAFRGTEARMPDAEARPWLRLPRPNRT